MNWALGTALNGLGLVCARRGHLRVSAQLEQHKADWRRRRLARRRRAFHKSKSPYLPPIGSDAAMCRVLDRGRTFYIAGRTGYADVLGRTRAARNTFLFRVFIFKCIMFLRQVRAQGKTHGKPPPAPLAPSRPAAAAAATVLINTTRNRRPLPDPQAHEGHATIHHQSNATRQSPWTITWTDRCNRMGGGPFTTMSRRGTCVDPRSKTAVRVPSVRFGREPARLGPRLGPIVFARAIGTATMCKHHADVNGIRTHRSRIEI